MQIKAGIVSILYSLIIRYINMTDIQPVFFDNKGYFKISMSGISKVDCIFYVCGTIFLSS